MSVLEVVSGLRLLRKVAKVPGLRSPQQADDPVFKRHRTPPYSVGRMPLVACCIGQRSFLGRSRRIGDKKTAAHFVPPFGLTASYLA